MINLVGHCNRDYGFKKGHLASRGLNFNRRDKRCMIVYKIKQSVLMYRELPDVFGGNTGQVKITFVQEIGKCSWGCLMARGKDRNHGYSEYKEAMLNSIHTGRKVQGTL